MTLKTILFFLYITIFFTSCYKKDVRPIVKKYKMDIEYYKNEDYKYNEIIDVKEISGDSTVFIYDYVNLQGENDTLVIKNDSAWFNQQLLRPLSKKKLRYNSNDYLIAKYYYDPLRSYANLYVNDSLGLVFTRLGTHPSGEIFIFYNTDEYNSLHNEIAKDSAFHKYEEY